jgi:hypothetical protein
MTSLRRVFALMLVALLSGGCLFGGDDDNPSPNAAPTTVAKSGSRTSATSAESNTDPTDAPEQAKPSSTAESNVIKGVVRDEQGDPVSGARIRIAGFTGKPNGLNAADTIKDAVTDRRGAYRLAVPRGLYGITAEADVRFDGKDYRSLYLHPADGNCEKQMSDNGIVKDFVLRLTGFMQCLTSPDPNNAGSYSGAAIALVPQTSSLPNDAKLTLTLTPLGQLADGSSGKTVTFTRTFAALRNFFGPIDTTNTLHDIPLGRYRLTGVATLAGGQRHTLLFAPSNTGAAVTPTQVHEVVFPAREMLPHGIGQAEIGVHLSGGAAPAPTTQPASPTTAAATPTTAAPAPTTTAPRTTSTCFSEHVGPIPC